MRAGLATFSKLEAAGFYDRLSRASGRLGEGLREAVKETGVTAQVSVAGSLMTVFFAPDVVLDYDEAKKSDTARFAAFFNAMLDRGILLPPSQFEAMFVSAAHSEEDIERTIVAARESLNAIQSAKSAG